MVTALILLTVLLPAAGAVMTGPLAGRAARVSAGTAALMTASLGIAAVVTAYPGGYRASLAGVPWLGSRAGGGVFGLQLDPLSSVLLLVVVVIGFLTVFFSTSYLTEQNRDHGVGPRDQGRYYFWLLLFLASMAGVATAPNFLQLFVFWELTTMCSWALISFYGTPKSLRAGFKALLMTHVGGVFFVVALLILFVATGSFAFDALARLAPGARVAVFACLMLAAWAKSAQVPIHTWLPDAMEAPTPISAYLHAAAMVKAGVYLMARAVSAGWAMPGSLAIVLGAMAVVTMFVALSYYFVQDDLKRLLAYSTIAHLGYVLLGVALGAMGITIGFRGGVLHIICHAFGKATLFFCAGAIAYATGTRSISGLGGLARRMPITAVAFFVGVLTVTGIPPFAAFWSKFMIFAGALSLPGAAGPVLLVLLLAETLTAFGWMLYVGQRVFFGTPSPAAATATDPPLTMRVTLLLLALACLAAPVAGIPLVRLIGG